MVHFLRQSQEAQDQTQVVTIQYRTPQSLEVGTAAAWLMRNLRPLPTPRGPSLPPGKQDTESSKQSGDLKGHPEHSFCKFPIKPKTREHGFTVLLESELMALCFSRGEVVMQAKGYLTHWPTLGSRKRRKWPNVVELYPLVHSVGMQSDYKIRSSPYEQSGLLLSSPSQVRHTQKYSQPIVL